MCWGWLRPRKRRKPAARRESLCWRGDGAGHLGTSADRGWDRGHGVVQFIDELPISISYGSAIKVGNSARYCNFSSGSLTSPLPRPKLEQAQLTGAQSTSPAWDRHKISVANRLRRRNQPVRRRKLRLDRHQRPISNWSFPVQHLQAALSLRHSTQRLLQQAE